MTSLVWLDLPPALAAAGAGRTSAGTAEASPLTTALTVEFTDPYALAYSSKGFITGVSTVVFKASAAVTDSGSLKVELAFIAY